MVTILAAVVLMGLLLFVVLGGGNVGRGGDGLR